MTSMAASETDAHKSSLDVLKRELATHRGEFLIGVAAEISRKDLINPPTLACKVLSITPLGIRLEVESAADIHHWMGASIKAVVAFPDAQAATYHGVVVGASPSSLGVSTQISVRVTETLSDRPKHLERRRHARWRCSDEFHPTGVAANPSKFNDFVLFRVLDISRSGMRLLTSLRNKFIVRDMILDAIVSFPMVSQVSLRLIVQNVTFVSEGEKDYLSVGVAMSRETPDQRGVISQYMAQFGDVDSLQEFRRDGFYSAATDGKLEFGVVRSEQDYREILNLRHLAYSAEGKLGKSASVNEASDIHDSRARILICRFQGKAVGTARLTFHEYGDITEHEEFLPWSHELPRRDESVEVTRVCTHPDFRGKGLLFALLRYVVITATQAGRTWVVSSSTEDLVPLYRFVGLTEVGLMYKHPDLNGLEHFVLAGSMIDALSGRSVGPTAWNAVWRDALPYLSNVHALPQDWLSRLRLAAYRLAAPIVLPLRFAMMKGLKS
jgi:GNAT superfamily N-acetyltransferase